MTWLTQLPWGLTAALFAAGWSAVSATPSVNVALKAAFHSPPYLVELLETAAPDNSTSYFNLLDLVAKGHFAIAKTDQQLYEKFLEVLQQDGHVTAETLSTFKLALSMRSAAPRIEAHYQYYATAVNGSVSKNQEDCPQWFLYDGKQYCDPSLERPAGSVKDNAQTRILPFDRATGSGHDEIILYADITSPSFGKFHEFASALAKKGEAKYRLRYRRSPAHPNETLQVHGYGVELALKRTDYIVIDDRAAAVADAVSDDSQKPLGSGADVVLDQEEEVADIKPLEKSELSSLGMKAASFILKSETPFETLLKLTQDFPKFSTSLAGYNVSEEFETEHDARAADIPPGTNVLWMNGVQLIDRQIQPFDLVDLLRRERKLIKGVLELGLTIEKAVSLLGHVEVAAASSGDEETPRFDWRDEIEGGKVIIWLNNIEKDKRYQKWTPALFALLHNMGGLPSVRRDIFNVVCTVDFSEKEDLELVTQQLLGLIKRMVPIRFGLVPLTPTPESVEQAKIIYHILETYGLKTMSQYLQELLDSKHAGTAREASFKKVIKDVPLREGAEALVLDQVLSSGPREKQISLAQQWVERLKAGGAVPSVFLDGDMFPRDQSWLRVMQTKLGQDLQMIQQAVYFGQIDEEMWIPGTFLQNAMKRRNSFIYPKSGDKMRVLNINKVYGENELLFSQLPVIEAFKDSVQNDWAALTVVVDLGSDEGRKLLLNALRCRQENPGIRMDIVHSPTDSATASPSFLLDKGAADRLLAIDGLSDLAKLLEKSEELSEGYRTALARFLVEANMDAGASYLVLNGRVVGPIPSGDDFKLDDFTEFLSLERKRRILPVYRAIKELDLTSHVSNPLDGAKLTSVTALSSVSDLPQGIFESAPASRTTIWQRWKSTYSSFQVGDASTATVHLVAVLNPASELAQKWAAILKVLSDLEGVHLRVFLNPKKGLGELPVKRFFRYVLEAAPTFDQEGHVKSLSATFQGVPSDTLLIAGLDVPPAWLVSSKVSVDDLDNLKIKDIKARRNTDRVEAIYELESILIEGHSRQVPGNAAPRGVQLVLATETDEHFADTIIMSNMGYFQFKANPGVYDIRLQTGRSSDIFDIQSIGTLGWTPMANDEGTEVALMDFQGSTLYPRLSRKAGKETEDVLEETTASSGPLTFVSKGLKFTQSLLGKMSPPDTQQAEINIFSVASGHLYERMLNIMMVSVMKHTKHTVKFWFIEQFLSPSFKDFIPTLAATYNFKYEMVTYKWPHWLRGQREKQREIWGYKILFLDVLFPLSLDKVIFVDADQVVRTDMYDLVTHDLQGAPYGFTPMCDSRVEMEGFRFWKTGYWANYLQGLPYHISALYVVDLRRFREMAAGDRLRQQYHGLSADPHSLSNLDQDLPNHMQFQIPIHSLPQEWLWCETWCSDETLASARTIDLCNNPQTKEPKLDRARRQVPEWTVYDEEIAEVDRRKKAGAKQVPSGEKNSMSRRLEEEPTPTGDRKDEL